MTASRRPPPASSPDADAARRRQKAASRKRAQRARDRSGEFVLRVVLPLQFLSVVIDLGWATADETRDMDLVAVVVRRFVETAMSQRPFTIAGPERNLVRKVNHDAPCPDNEEAKQRNAGR
jgi:hypothetical protein